MSKLAPTRYRTTNWKSCNDALKRHGSLLVWLDKDKEWRGPKAGRKELSERCGLRQAGRLGSLPA